MAEKRMFSKSIIDSDSFLDMPPSAQALYFHLSMRADDEGFINNPKKVQKIIGSSKNDLKILISKKFILFFNSGVAVIKHWRVHNNIREDRIKKTVHQKEMAQLSVKDNNAYTFLSDKCQADDSKVSDKCQAYDGKKTDKFCQNVTVDIDIVNSSSKEKDLSKERSKEKGDNVAFSLSQKSVRHKYGLYKNVLLSDEEMNKLKFEFPDDYEQRVELLSEYMASTGKSYKSHLATIRSWNRRDQKKNLKPNVREGEAIGTVL